MPSGACVIAYKGARGVTWRVKYRDTDGRQVKETLGREQNGWNRRRAERELGKRPRPSGCPRAPHADT